MTKTIISTENKPTLKLISGNYIWMIGNRCLDIEEEFNENKSSFWSIKRHKWIKGPKLPAEIGHNDYTLAIAEAIFFMENIDENDYVLEMGGLKGGGGLYPSRNLGF